MILMLREIY